jgi:hypothetical protein
MSQMCQIRTFIPLSVGAPPEEIAVLSLELAKIILGIDNPGEWPGLRSAIP